MKPPVIPGRKPATGSSPAFSPLDVPGILFFYDFADWSTMYQDVAGTTPVTTVGQQVKNTSNITGDANFGPLVRVGDGPTLGADFIEYNGSSSSLETTQNLATISQPCWSFFGIKPGAVFNVNTRGFANANAPFNANFNPTSGFAINIDGAAYLVEGSVNTTDGQTFLLRANGALSELYKDGSLVATGNQGTGVMWATSGTRRYGWRSSATDQYFLGRAYCLIGGSGLISAENIANLQAWAQSRYTDI